MLLVAVFGISAHWFFVLAYRQAPASLIAPVNYVHLVWAVILGWLIFGQIPTWITLGGISLILVSGVAVAWLGHQEKQRGLPNS